MGHGSVVNTYNLYLQIAAQFGLFILGIFLFVIYRFFKCSMHGLKKINNPFYYAVVLGSCAGVLGLLIEGVAESSLGSRISPLFWMQIAIGVATVANSTSKSASRDHKRV